MRVSVMATVTLALLTTSISFAGLSKINTEKAKAFLAKSGACVVAFSSQSENTVVNPVYCVWNGVANAGTIHESTGCFVGRYDMEAPSGARQYSPMWNSGAGLQARSQPNGSCTREIILKMLTEYPLEEYLGIGREKMPILTSFRKSDKKITVFFDPNEIFSVDVMKKVDSWSPPKSSQSSKSKMTKRRLPSPEKNPVCKVQAVINSDAWQCEDQRKLELHACDIRERSARFREQGQSVDLEEHELSQLVEIYQARFQKSPPEICDPEEMKDFRKTRGH